MWTETSTQAGNCLFSKSAAILKWHTIFHQSDVCLMNFELIMISSAYVCFTGPGCDFECLKLKPFQIYTHWPFYYEHMTSI